jgi:2'-5' RNA ligase
MDTEHKYSSTQANLRGDLARAVLAFAHQIPDGELADDGRETEPHVTCKYGIHGDDAGEVADALDGEGPITLKLGKVSIFPASEDRPSDVVKLDVDSPDLHRLNKKLADALPHTDTHPRYVPHVTIAYVKPGMGRKYAGRDDLEGQRATIDRIRFSDKRGMATDLHLSGGKVRMSRCRQWDFSGDRSRFVEMARAAGGQGQGQLHFITKNGKRVPIGGGGQGQQARMFDGSGDSSSTAPKSAPVPTASATKGAESQAPSAVAPADPSQDPKEPYHAFVQPQAESGQQASGGGAGELSPEDDYKQNGTRAKAFVAWFGDWQNDPANASKVVNEKGEPQETQPISGEASKVMREGKPVAVYHGTSQGGFTQFDKSKLGDPEVLLYGPGFYFTEDQGVAKEYTSKGIKYDLLMTPTQTEKELKSRIAGLSSLSESERRSLNEMAENPRAVTPAFWQQNGVRTLGIYETTAKTEVKEAYLNIRKPFDINADVSIVDAEKIYDSQMRPGFAEKRFPGRQSIRGEELYDSLSATKGKESANQALAAAGYDGITHIGGSVMGDRDHRVWIAFESHQIKSTANRGTFDPSNPDIRMSRWDFSKTPPRFVSGVEMARGFKDSRGKFHPIRDTGPGLFDAGSTAHAAPVPAPVPSQSSLSSAPLPEFAARVQKLADEHPVGFGSNKVFIHHVHEASGDPMGLPDFKRRVKQANTAGLLKVSRLDMTDAVHPDDLYASDTNLAPGQDAAHAGRGVVNTHAGNFILAADRARQPVRPAPARPEAAATGRPPKPWELPRSERVRQGYADVHEHTLAEYRQKNSHPAEPFDQAPREVQKAVNDEHRSKVEEALEGGDTVHPEVLADYPDLAKRHGVRMSRWSRGDDGRMRFDAVAMDRGGSAPTGFFRRGGKVIPIHAPGGGYTPEYSEHLDTLIKEGPERLGLNNPSPIAGKSAPVPTPQTAQKRPATAGKGRPSVVHAVDQEARAAAAFGHLTLPVGPDGKLNPHLADAYKRALGKTGHEVGEFKPGRAGHVTAAVTRKGATAGEKTPYNAFVQPKASPAAPAESIARPAAEPAPKPQAPPVAPKPAEDLSDRVNQFGANLAEGRVRAQKAANKRIGELKEKLAEAKSGGKPAAEPKPEPAKAPESKPEEAAPKKGGFGRPMGTKPKKSGDGRWRMVNGRPVFIEGGKKQDAGPTTTPGVVNTLTGRVLITEPPAERNKSATNVRSQVDNPQSVTASGATKAQQKPRVLVTPPPGQAESEPKAQPPRPAEATATPPAAPQEPPKPTEAPKPAGPPATPQAQGRQGPHQGRDRAAPAGRGSGTPGIAAEFEDEKALQDFHAPFAFHRQAPRRGQGLPPGPRPPQAAVHVTRRPEQGAGRRRDGEAGQDRYFALAERGRASRIGQALEHARNTPTPKSEAGRVDLRHDAGRGERGKVENVHPDKLNLDDAGTINGLPVKVTIDADGNKILTDGGDLPETPIDALTKPLPFDKGSRCTRRSRYPDAWMKAAMSRDAAGQSYWFTNAHGQRVFAQGHSQGGLFGGGGAKAAAPVPEAAKAKEPHEMMQEEYLHQKRTEHLERNRRNGTMGVMSGLEQAQHAAEHGRLVRDAIAIGKAVPDHVREEHERDYLAAPKPPAGNADVDVSRQFGLYSKDAAGNPQEVGERAGQADLFNPSKYKTAAPPAEPEPVKPQFDPRHTAEMFPAKGLLDDLPPATAHPIDPTPAAPRAKATAPKPPTAYIPLGGRLERIRSLRKQGLTFQEAKSHQASEAASGNELPIHPDLLRGIERANESDQDRSWREYRENAGRVAVDPHAASAKDLERATGYLHAARSHEIRKAEREGREAHPELLRGYDNEIAHYGQLVKQKKAADSLAHMRAPAGGKTSDVNGKFYPGGHLTPIHGQYSGQQKAPKQATGAAAETPKGEGKERTRPAPQSMSAEELAERAESRRLGGLADAARATPLGELIDWRGATGPGDHATPRTGTVIMQPWRAFAEEVGDDARLKAVADKLRPMMHPDAAEDFDYQLNHPQGVKSILPKKHHAAYPSSAEAHTVLEGAVREAGPEKLHAVGKVLDEAVAPKRAAAREIAGDARAHGFLPNRFPGTTAKGERVKAGEGFVRKNAAGEYETFTHEHVRQHVAGAKSPAPSVQADLDRVHREAVERVRARKAAQQGKTQMSRLFDTDDRGRWITNHEGKRVFIGGSQGHLFGEQPRVAPKAAPVPTPVPEAKPAEKLGLETGPVAGGTPHERAASLSARAIAYAKAGKSMKDLSDSLPAGHAAQLAVELPQTPAQSFSRVWKDAMKGHDRRGVIEADAKAVAEVKAAQDRQRAEQEAKAKAERETHERGMAEAAERDKASRAREAEDKARREREKSEEAATQKANRESGKALLVQGHPKRAGSALHVDAATHDRIRDHFGGVEGARIAHGGKEYTVTGAGTEFKDDNRVRSRYLYVQTDEGKAKAEADERLRQQNLSRPAVGPAVHHELEGKGANVGQIVMQGEVPHVVTKVHPPEYWSGDRIADEDEYGRSVGYHTPVELTPVQWRDGDPETPTMKKTRRANAFEDFLKAGPARVVHDELPEWYIGDGRYGKPNADENRPGIYVHRGPYPTEPEYFRKRDDGKYEELGRFKDPTRATYMSRSARWVKASGGWRFEGRAMQVA